MDREQLPISGESDGAPKESIPQDGVQEHRASVLYGSDQEHLTYGISQPEDAMRHIFFGPGGLRPGWGLLLFFLLFHGLQQLTALAFQTTQHRAQDSSAETQLHMSRLQTPDSMVAGEGLGFGLVSLTTWIMSRVERRRVTTYGFGGQRRLFRFIAGFAWGIIFLSTLVGTLWKTGLLVFDGRLLSGRAIFEEGAIWFLGFLLVGLFEEYLLRGYLQFTLSRGAASLCEMLFGLEDGRSYGFWIAAIILSFYFGFGHRSNPGESPLGLVSAGLIGLVFCFSLWRTGSLWWAVGFHAAWDWAQSFVFGVADSGLMVEGRLFGTHPAGKVLWSGGATGPEASILVLFVLAVVVVVIRATLPRHREWPIEEAAVAGQL